MTKIILAISVFLSTTSVSFADGLKSFTISARAESVFGVQTKSLKDFPSKQGQLSFIEIPSQALIHSQDNLGIYVRISKEFQWVPVKKIESRNHSVQVQLESKLSQDAQIVVQGGQFLRTIELDLLENGSPQEGEDEDD